LRHGSADGKWREAKSAEMIPRHVIAGRGGASKVCSAIQPGMIDEQRKTNNEERTTKNETTKNEQRTTNNEQRRTNNEQRATKDEQRITKDERRP
jgi:hypothetical protein